MLLTLLVNKLLFVVFVISSLIILRHMYAFTVNFLSNEPKKYTLTPTQLLYLTIALGIVITDIIKGISL
jgi:hypothetical protein